jgi:hypothetical protein
MGPPTSTAVPGLPQPGGRMTERPVVLQAQGPLQRTAA